MTRSAGWLAHVALPLAAGAGSYVVYRSSSLLGWSWARALHLEPALALVRDIGRGAGWTPPAPVVFTLPDALWVYALAWALARVPREHRPAERAFWLAFPFALGPGAELGQAIGLVPGTFDVHDLIACIAAATLGALTGSIEHRAG